MALAAHTRKIYAKSTNVAPSGSDEVDGAIDFKITRSKAMLDTTDFKDTSGAHTRIAGLEDASGSIGGDWEQGDAVQALLRSSYEFGATVYITDLPDGTNGWTYPCLVESIEDNGQVDGKDQTTFNLQLNGAKIVRP